MQSKSSFELAREWTKNGLFHWQEDVRSNYFDTREFTHERHTVLTAFLNTYEYRIETKTYHSQEMHSFEVAIVLKSKSIYIEPIEWNCHNPDSVLVIVPLVFDNVKNLLSDINTMIKLRVKFHEILPKSGIYLPLYS